MKFSCTAFLFVTITLYGGVQAFVPAATRRGTTTTTRLMAEKKASSPLLTTATMLAGWALASQVAVASGNNLGQPAADLTALQAPSTTTTMPSTVLAAGAYIPEDSYMSLDLSMPSYNTQGNAEMLTAPGSKLSSASGGGGMMVPKAATTTKKSAKPEDPAKAAARAQKEAEKRLAQEKKKAETLAKMQAKKAERAAIQSKRVVSATVAED